jgi:hypothetical protein
MADFSVRSDSVNVEQIMEQIRARIREKRGVDYTEQQIRELAAVKLEKFLDPRGVRSDLLDQFRKAQPAYEPPELPNFAFEESTLFESHRAPIRWMRKLLLPVLKLFFNPNPLIQALNVQSRLNTMNAEREARREATRRQMDQLYYELMHNLVVETTRLGIEVKNLKMRLESVSSRLEFNERRARSLESVVVYKTSSEEPAPRQSAPASPIPPQQHRQADAAQRSYPQQTQPPITPPDAGRPQAAPDGAAAQGGGTQGQPGEGPGQRSRRRRRRRGRRGGASAQAIMGGPGDQASTLRTQGSPPAPPSAPSSGADAHSTGEPASGAPPVAPSLESLPSSHVGPSEAAQPDDDDVENRSHGAGGTSAGSAAEPSTESPAPPTGPHDGGSDPNAQ